MAHEPILIVDVNAQNLKLARLILVGAGYEVKTAIDAEEALAILESFVPRLILTDLQLPRMDGFEFTRQIKADPTRRSIIIIAITAYAMKGDDDRAVTSRSLWISRSSRASLPGTWPVSIASAAEQRDGPDASRCRERARQISQSGDRQEGWCWRQF